MCTGIEIAMLVGTGFSAVSQADAASRKRAISNYQAAQMVEDAKADTYRAETMADKIRRAGRAQKAEAKSALAASGVAADEGTALTIADDIGVRVESDATAELLTGQRRQARTETEAEFVRQGARNEERASYASAGGTLLQGGAQSYTSWKGRK